MRNNSVVLIAIKAFLRSEKVFTMKIVALILLSIVASSKAQSDPNYCYSTDNIKPQRAMFSTKTAYEVVRGRSINPSVSSECEKGSFCW